MRSGRVVESASSSASALAKDVVRKPACSNHRVTMATVVASSSTALPVFTASLTYVNAMFQPTLKYGQLVSLQRDVFGRHGFERVDKEGKHNHEWPELQ